VEPLLPSHCTLEDSEEQAGLGHTGQAGQAQTLEVRRCWGIRGAGLSSIRGRAPVLPPGEEADAPLLGGVILAFSVGLPDSRVQLILQKLWHLGVNT
jgi:hypothetical protein